MTKFTAKPQDMSFNNKKKVFKIHNYTLRTCTIPVIITIIQHIRLKHPSNQTYPGKSYQTYRQVRLACNVRFCWLLSRQWQNKSIRRLTKRKWWKNRKSPNQFRIVLFHTNCVANHLVFGVFLFINDTPWQGLIARWEEVDTGNMRTGSYF